jgi:ABC-type dipeptide/oligopeptide/nickel transport system permease component
VGGNAMLGFMAAVAFATILSNLLADLMYKAVDPRVQLK